MAERREISAESSNVEIERLSGEDKIALIEAISGTITLAELQRVRDLLTTTYTTRIEEERAALIAEMENRFEALGVSLEDIMTNRKQRQIKQPSIPKYRSPDGKTWSGRGVPPQWIREIEQNGQNREDYRISIENG